MSLVPTFVKCNDNYWYECPIWQGKTDIGGKWFLCVDDDDDPELVIKETIFGIEIPDLPWLKLTSVNSTCGQRIFTKNKFEKAFSFWGEFRESPPPPQKYDSRSKQKPNRDCVYYELIKG